MAWHFDPATGCPFWLERARTLGWDPRERITSFADLETLRRVRRRVAARRSRAALGPEGLRGQAGVSCSRPAARPAFRRRASTARTSGSTTRSSARTFPDEHFPKGANWLMLGPSGPAAPAAGRRASVSASRRHLLLRGPRSPLGHQVDQEGMERAPERLQGSRHRSGGDHPAGRPRHPVHVHDAEAARGARPAARVDGHVDRQDRASRASSPAARNSRRSGTASRTRNCSTAPS